MATCQDRTACVMEMQVPVDQFGLLIKTGQRWRLNFRRKQWRLGETADWQISLTHDSAGFGVLEFR
jgi:hypothetical protein